jgi:hypothetical protein
MSTFAYGHTLLMMHTLSLQLATLPLSSAFTSSSSRESSGSDPRQTLHADLTLLASDQLSPTQKLKWVAHMWRSYSFLSATE